MTSPYLQQLAYCGKLESLRDPVIVSILALTGYNDDTFTIDDFVADLPQYTATEVQDGVAWCVRVGFLRYKFNPDNSGNRLYYYDVNAVNRATSNYSMMIYFHPLTTFPNYLSGGINLYSSGGYTGYNGYPYFVNSQKGTYTG